MTKPRIPLVCRGSFTDGLGHVTRTIAVARALREQGAVAPMIVIGDEAAEHLVVALDEEFQVLLDDDDGLTAQLASLDPSAVAFDAVEISANEFDRIQSRWPTASLSPVFNQLHRVNRSYSRTARHRPDTPVTPERRRWGLEYAVISPRVQVVDESSYARQLDSPVLSIGVSMGGSDAPNRTMQVLEQLGSVDRRLLIWVMLGEGYNHSYDQLVQMSRADRKHEIVLARTTRSMWSVLRGCSVLILAGGTTTYEAAFAGIPSVNILERPDRAFLVEELMEQGAVWVANTHGIDGEPAPPNSIAERVQSLIDDREQLLRAHKCCHGLIDGRGATRIARDLVGLAADVSRT